jgi:hypothetical protein
MVISPQFGQLNFVAFEPGGIVRLQLVQIGVCRVVAILSEVLMVSFPFEGSLYITGLLIFAVPDLHAQRSIETTRTTVSWRISRFRVPFRGLPAIALGNGANL